MGFPLLIALYIQGKSAVEDSFYSNEPDTTQIEGYTYFVSHGIEFDSNSNIDLYNAIYPLVGIPHSSTAGRRGLDCSGLVKNIYNRHFGTNLKGASRDILRQTTEIPRKHMQEGDLVFFRIGSTRVNHVGIYLQNNKFIHSAASRGVGIDNLNDDYYQSHFYKVGRITGIGKK
jgi:hypothetical protein